MIEAIEVRGFRNLEPATIVLGAGGSLVLGANGAGKTSLLEAIYLLATSRSFRTPRVADCLHRPSTPPPTGEAATTGFRLTGETESRQQLQIVFEAGESHRRLNGERTALARYLAVLPVVSWTGNDNEVLVGPPQSRRRFLDRGIVGTHPASIDVISRYRRALFEKRRLLQGATNLEELMPWNLVLASAAAQLVRRRAEYLEAFRRCFEEVSAICDLGLPNIDLEYRPSPREGLAGEAAMADRLEAEAIRELAAERPLLGPHRDDLLIRWRGRAVREIASAGERKALGLLLTAAHGRVLEQAGIEPIYLLDDVDIELDQERLASLWRHFASARQLLATSNRPFVWRGLAVEQRLEASLGSLRQM